jgi:hypothetical protein
VSQWVIRAGQKVHARRELHVRYRPGSTNNRVEADGSADGSIYSGASWGCTISCLALCCIKKFQDYQTADCERVAYQLVQVPAETINIVGKWF